MVSVLMTWVAHFFLAAVVCTCSFDCHGLYLSSEILLELGAGPSSGAGDWGEDYRMGMREQNEGSSAAGRASRWLIWSSDWCGLYLS